MLSKIGLRSAGASSQVIMARGVATTPTLQVGYQQQGHYGYILGRTHAIPTLVAMPGHHGQRCGNYSYSSVRKSAIITLVARFHGLISGRTHAIPTLVARSSWLEEWQLLLFFSQQICHNYIISKVSWPHFRQDTCHLLQQQGHHHGQRSGNYSYSSGKTPAILTLVARYSWLDE